MGDQDKLFQHRWGIRRTGNDFDSSSDDDHSMPTSAIEPTIMKHKPVVTRQFSDEHVQQNTTSQFPRAEKAKHPHIEQADQNRKSRSNKKAAFNHEQPSNASLTDLRGYMQSLVDEIKVARKDLLSWMNQKIEFPYKDDDVTKRAPTKNTRTRKVSTNMSKRKRPVAKISQIREDGPSEDRTTPKTKGEIVVPPKEGENVVIAIPAEMPEKPKKGKNSRSKNSKLTSKKPKIVGNVADKQSDKAKSTSETENQRNSLNSAMNLNTHQVKYDLRGQQKDSLFTRNGPSEVCDLRGQQKDSHFTRNGPSEVCDLRGQQKDSHFTRNSSSEVCDQYEHNTVPSMYNVNGNVFPFSYVSQGLTAGSGLKNIQSPFAIQYLGQGNRMLGFQRESPRFSNANHSFVGGYGGFNQHLSKFNVQQGGVMGLQCPDVRRPPNQ